MMGAKVNDDWLPVTYNGKFGFVFDQYVTIRGAAAEGVTQASPTAQTGPASLAPGRAVSC